MIKKAKTKKEWDKIIVIGVIALCIISTFYLFSLRSTGQAINQDGLDFNEAISHFTYSTIKLSVMYNRFSQFY